MLLLHLWWLELRRTTERTTTRHLRRERPRLLGRLLYRHRCLMLLRLRRRWRRGLVPNEIPQLRLRLSLGLRQTERRTGRDTIGGGGTHGWRNEAGRERRWDVLSGEFTLDEVHCDGEAVTGEAAVVVQVG